MLYAFLIYKSLSWLWYYDFLFGPGSIVYINGTLAGGFQKFAFILYGNPNGSYAFIFSVLGISVFLLARLQATPLWISLPFNFILWFFVLNLQNAIYSTLTGGSYLLNQFLFFNCFLSTTLMKRDEIEISSLRVCIHNLAALAIIIQICLTYFLSAVAKLNDPGWLSGWALGSVFEVDHYFLFRSGSIKFPVWLSSLFNYLILSYQFIFPFSILFSRFKKPFLITGIVMHLYIAFVMGLTDFGIIMILGYIYFWPFKERVQ